MVSKGGLIVGIAAVAGLGIAAYALSKQQAPKQFIGCTSDSQCPTGQVCINGTCGYGGVTTTTPPSGCTNNLQCLPGQVCTNGSCIPISSYQEYQCINNGGSWIEGKCIYPSRCTSSSQCPEPTVCRNGYCSQCPSGTYYYKNPGTGIGECLSSIRTRCHGGVCPQGSLTWE